MKYLFIANKKIITDNATGFKKYDIWETGDGNFSYFEKVAFCPNCNYMDYLYNFFEKKDPVDKKLSAKDLIEIRYVSPSKIFKLKNVPQTQGVDNTIYNLSCRCPKCKFNLNNIQKQYISLNNSDYNNYILKEYNIVPSNETIKINAIVERIIPIVSKGKIGKQSIYIKIVINTRKGYTYVLEPRDANNKRIGSYKGSRIANITYGNYGPSYKFIRPLIENTDFLSEIKKYILLTREQDFLSIMFKNRFPMLDEKSIAKLISELLYGNITDKAFDIIKKIKPEDTTIREILSKLKAPQTTENIRKVGLNNINAFNYGILSDMGFQNSDTMNNIITTLVNQNNTLFYSIRKNNLVKKMISINGEALTSKKIIQLINTHEDEWRQLYEEAENAYTLLSNNNIKIPSYALKGSFDKIKQSLSNLYAENDSILKNKAISYSNDERELEDVIDGFHFELPKDTHALFIIGQQLHICAADYSLIAINKESTIIQMVLKNEIIGCLEVKNNSLIQAKAICNNLLQEKKAVALKKWVEKHHINTCGCHDYNHIRNNEIEYDESKIYQDKTQYNIFAF